ncbi:MAG TPA: zinc-binding alcohol dehydrogenase family protein [Terriglobales bacterium]|nr:zinc-binding alcohol dehydrogenase family protein [Terriglobales bacterium]
MKQIVLQSPGEFVEREASAPSHSPQEAIVRIHKVGVCGSDFHAFAGRHAFYTYPRVLGHELAGEVVEIGPNDAEIRPGDRCAIEPYISCGRCKACKLGHTNCCEQIRVIGIHVDGGMQGLLSVPTSLLFKSSKLSFDELALIETLGIGAHAVDRSNIAPGESVLVIGAGPIGLAVAEFAKVAGANVCIIEKNPWRKSFATSLGFKAISESDGHVYDVVFDATGSSASMSASLSYVAPTGRLVFVGLTKDPITIDDSLFHQREMTIFASRNSRGQFPRIIRMLEEGKINTIPWITDRMPIADVPAEFKNLSSRPNLIKAIVDVEDLTS